MAGGRLQVALAQSRYLVRVASCKIYLAVAQYFQFLYEGLSTGSAAIDQDPIIRTDSKFIDASPQCDKIGIRILNILSRHWGITETGLGRGGEEKGIGCDIMQPHSGGKALFKRTGDGKSLQAEALCQPA